MLNLDPALAVCPTSLHSLHAQVWLSPPWQLFRAPSKAAVLSDGCCSCPLPWWEWRRCSKTGIATDSHWCCSTENLFLCLVTFLTEKQFWEVTTQILNSHWSGFKCRTSPNSFCAFQGAPRCISYLSCFIHVDCCCFFYLSSQLSSPLGRRGVINLWALFSYAADIISTVEFNHSGELLATGDKGGRVVIFQQEQEVSA